MCKTLGQFFEPLYVQYYSTEAISTVHTIGMLCNSLWGLTPKQKRILYWACTIPIATYGFYLWYNDFAKCKGHLQSLTKMQCCAALWIISTFRMSPTDGYEALAGLIPIHLHLRKLASRATYRVVTLSRTQRAWSSMGRHDALGAHMHWWHINNLGTKAFLATKSTAVDIAGKLPRLRRVFNTDSNKARPGNQIMDVFSNRISFHPRPNSASADEQITLLDATLLNAKGEEHSAIMACDSSIPQDSTMQALAAARVWIGDCMVRQTCQASGRAMAPDAELHAIWAGISMAMAVASVDHIYVFTDHLPSAERAVDLGIHSGTKLKQSANNWEDWSAKLRIVLCKHRTEIYILGDEYKPDEDSSPIDWTNWLCNHAMICGFVLKSIDVAKQCYFQELYNAAIAKLYNRGRPLSKVELFAKILLKPFSWETPIIDQYRTIMDNGVNKILSDPIPSKDEIGLMVMLYLMNNSDMVMELQSVRTALMYKPTTSHLGILQQLLNAKHDCANRPTQSFALTATSQMTAASSSTIPPLPTSSAKVQCMNPNCNLLGHNIAWCIRPGGGMEGKTVEEVKALHAKGKKNFKKKPVPAKFTIKGKNYMIDSDTGLVFAEVSLSKTSPTAHVESLASFVANSMCDADIEELANTAGEAVALYVPDTNVHLVSVAALTENIPGSVLFSDNEAIVYDAQHQVVATVTCVLGRKLWRLNAHSIQINSANIAAPVPNLEQWHCHLRHANNQAIYDMATKSLVTGMHVDLSTAPPKCDACILGKQTCKHVLSTHTHAKSTRRLEIVYPWTYVLRQKSNALPVFQAWVDKAEAECGERIGLIRSDNGELRSKEMDCWCFECHYKREYTAPYTSAHIGKVECMHLTIANKTASYLTAHTYTRSTGCTPYELWFGHRPNLAHLQEIGAQAFTLILNKHNPKIRAHSMECIMIGYSEDLKAYRLYHQKTGKVIVSYHVDFIESIDTQPHVLPKPQVIDIPSLPTVPSSPPPPVEAPVVVVDPTPVLPQCSPRLAGGFLDPSLFSEPIIADTLSVANSVPPFGAQSDPQTRKANKQQQWELRVALQRVPDVEYDAEEDSALTAMLDSVALPAGEITALAHPDADLWKASIVDELTSLCERQVFTLVPHSDIPAGHVILDSKFVFVTKADESLCLLLHLAAVCDLEICQLDVKTAFLYGSLPEGEFQFMEQLEGFEEEGKEDFVWRIEKGLYGMHQSGRVWHKTLDSALAGWGLVHLPSEPCGYQRVLVEGVLDACVHIDDFLYVSSSKDATHRFLKEMGEKWQFVDLGLLIDKIGSLFLTDSFVPVYTPMDPDIKLRWPDKDEVLLPQHQRSLKSLPYRSLVGSMMYVAVGSCPDIAYSVSKLAQYLDCYREEHYEAALRCTQYLVTMQDFKLWLGGSEDIHLIGFSDSSFADFISWNAKKQKTVTCSMTEAEYVAVAEVTRELLWLCQQLSDRGLPMPEATVIFCDNNAAMSLSKDPVHHSQNKHIDVRHHFIREKIDGQDINIWILFEKHCLALGVQASTRGRVQQ
ncbi:hypothetical protein NP233_g5941 [Leucocoprinus birnbaumii]|uniref:Reverse transcriptase Ty1/copia-type domain-containing protein n=1 Tax=Leucocoprinus birnbaumii TaxID=56174 RepID=A0AAD5VRX2_9AGAR|nr:hypothetical protein NP233_g5941 [Leucocoprinus birnbaumii]